MSAAALGIDPARTLTLTGGLGLAGAPLANSSGQAITTLVPIIRTGGYGLVHANGGSATKHAIGIYGRRQCVGSTGPDTLARAASDGLVGVSAPLPSGP